MLHLDSTQELRGFLAIQDQDLIRHQAQGKTLSGGPLDPHGEWLKNAETWSHQRSGAEVWQAKSGGYSKSCSKTPGVYQQNNDARMDCKKLAHQPRFS